MNQNSWPVQVYCFARHTHREHGIPSPPPPTPLTPPHRFPLPDSHASWLQTDFPGRSWIWYWLILGFLIPLRGLFKPSLFLLVHTKINTIFKRGPFPFLRRLQNSWHHFAKPARVTASERASASSNSSCPAYRTKVTRIMIACVQTSPSIYRLVYWIVFTEVLMTGMYPMYLLLYFQI